MSRSEAKTKRRKVWVNIHDGGVNGDYATAWLNRKAAKTNSGVRARAVAIPFVEARPGDVVLSREDVDALAFALANALWGLDSKYMLSDRGPVIAAAISDFRGGR